MNHGLRDTAHSACNLKDNAIAYGMVNPQNMTIWRSDLDLQTEVKEIAGYIAPAASTFGNY